MAKRLFSRLVRIRDNGNATYGIWTVYLGAEKLLDLVTLEPSDFFNLKYVSCIPEGTYLLKKRWSKKYGHHFILEDVDGRTYILVHSGNLFQDTEGCIIVGEYFGYVNGDAILDVKGSKRALERLNEILPDESEIVIGKADVFQDWKRAS